MMAAKRPVKVPFADTESTAPKVELPAAAAAAVAKPPVVPAIPAEPTPSEAIAQTAETIVETPAAVAAPIQKEVETMNETIQNATAETTDRANAMFGDMNARTQQAVDKSSKLFEEMNAFTRGNMEAMVESSKIAAKGAEDMARYAADYGRKSVEQSNENAKRFASVKSPTELFQLQSELMKSSIDAMVGEASKFSENYLKLMGEVVQPLSSRAAVAAEKVKIAA